MGSLVAIPLLDLLPTRPVLLGCLSVQIIALAAFTYATAWGQLALARFLSGASQVIITILLPVWVDAFAPSDSKTTWMTLIIVAAPKGMLAGYGLSALLMTYN